MATVTGLTAARMLEIEGATVVDGAFDSTGHLILERHDGTTFDAGVMSDATSAQKGIVEFATSAECTTGTATDLAVTPEGLKTVADTKQPIDNDLTAIAAISPANDDFIQRKSGIWVNRTAAQAAVDIATALQFMSGAWTSYTPIWTAVTTNPSLGNGTLNGRYVRSGRTITGYVNLVAGSTTTYGSGDYAFSIPVAASASMLTSIGLAQFLGGSRWGGQTIIVANGTTMTVFLSASATDPRLVAMTPSIPEAIGTGEQLRLEFCYEAAS